MSLGWLLMRLALFVAPAAALRGWNPMEAAFDGFFEMVLREGSDVRELVVGPLRMCKVSGVQLLHGCLPPQPPAMTQGMVSKLDNEVKKMGEKAGEDFLKAHGIPEHECIVHCGLKLFFELSYDCHQPGIYMEHNADVLWYTFEDMPERKKNKMWSIGSWTANDVRGLQDADYNRKEIRKLFHQPRRMTVFDLMFEMYRRDPHVQDYDAIEHNCCNWADMMLEMLAPAGQLEEVQAKHRQSYTVIKQAAQNLFGKKLANVVLGAIKFGAKHSHTKMESELFKDVSKRWSKPCGGRHECLPLRPSKEKKADRGQAVAKRKAVPLEGGISDEESAVLMASLKDLLKPGGFLTVRQEAIEACSRNSDCTPPLKS